jgi:hypothetical protein
LPGFGRIFNRKVEEVEKGKKRGRKRKTTTNLRFAFADRTDFWFQMYEIVPKN